MHDRTAPPRGSKFMVGRLWLRVPDSAIRGQGLTVVRKQKNCTIKVLDAHQVFCFCPIFPDSALFMGFVYGLEFRVQGSAFRSAELITGLKAEELHDRTARCPPSSKLKVCMGLKFWV